MKLFFFLPEVYFPMTLAEMSLVLLLVVFLFSTSFAAEVGRARLELPSTGVSQAAARDSSVPVDDARLQAEIAAAAAKGSAAAVPDFRRRFQVVRAARPPVIDGRLDDPVWRDAVVLKDFTVSQGVNDHGLPERAENETQAMVLFDDAGLYVGVRAWQDPKTIYTRIKENGGLRPDLDWEQRSEEWANTGCDEIEIAVDPELTMASYFVFHVNPDGVRQKHYMPPVPTEGGTYKRVDPVLIPDDAWRAATSRDDKGWYAEVFIPYECIGMKPIVPAGPKDIFFDMVQDRTVMGFNVNRVSHEIHEPSSWSPSKAVMFFRDVENFANAYFRQFPVNFEDFTLGAPAPGATRLAFTVRSRSQESQNLTLTLVAAGGGKSYERKQKMTLLPGAAKPVEMNFEAAPSGRQTVEVRLLSADGEVYDRARYLFEIPPPVEMTVLKTILYEGEKDVPVALRVNVAADEIRSRILSNGDLLASTPSRLQSVESLLPFEVSGVPAGEYEFSVEALQSGKEVGSARQAVRVIADPWKGTFAGRAGEGAGAAGVPAGFAALADGLPDAPEPTPGDVAIPYLDDEMKAKGYLFYAVTPTDDFRGGGGAPRRGRQRRQGASFPRRAELSEPIRAFAAGDEYEAVSFAVFALDDLRNPRVEFTQLRSDSGGVIAPDQMDLRAERLDNFLVKQETLGDVPKNTGRRYFLTIYVAPGTPAGVYRGTVTFTAEGKTAEERPYSLLVLPFKLEHSPLDNGIYGQMRGSHDTHYDFMVSADLLAHGMDNFTCVSVLKPAEKAMIHHLIWDLPKPTEEYWLGDGAQRFNVEVDKQVFKNLKDSGQRGPFVIEVNYLLRYLPCTEENAQRFEGFIRRIEALREKYGLDEFTYHLVDEPSNHYSYDDGRYGRRYGLERVDYFGKVLHKIGVRSYVTLNSPGRGYDTAEKIYDQVDIWCSNFISDMKQIERWTRPGKELWLYNYAGDGWAKGAMRGTYGFYALAVGAKGVTIWHHPIYVGWNEEEKRCVAKASWDAAREGIDDVRYAAALGAAIGRARAAGGRKARLADDAEKALDAVVNAYPPLTRDKIAFEAKHDASDWNKWRWIIADWIVRLSS